MNLGESAVLRSRRIWGFGLVGVGEIAEGVAVGERRLRLEVSEDEEAGERG